MSEISPNDDEVSDMENFSSLLGDSVRGMKELDKTLFNTTITLPAVKCKAKSCGKFLAAYKDVLFKRPHFKKIIDDPVTGKANKLMLLHPNIHTTADLNETQTQLLASESGEFQESNTLSITYDDFTFNEIIHSILPGDCETVTAFETVGHIAHVNLKEHLHVFKFVIGKVLLDKNVHIKTVVNKMNTINATFRFFEMELLAGEDRMKTSLSEHGCVFEFDYSKVYWNSRLQSEHKRLVDFISPGDFVFDVFAGVGPFSVPAAKKNCNVFANDLNPSSYEALTHNAKLNKVSQRIKAFNLDGRKFLYKIFIEDHLLEHPDKVTEGNNSHVVMNLPTIAPAFLDIFKQIYESGSSAPKVKSNVFIHCYCFSKSKEQPERDAETNIQTIMGLDELPDVSTHLVRRVAPNKVMLCVTFNLPWFENPTDISTDGLVDVAVESNENALPVKRSADEQLDGGDPKRVAIFSS